ncbi:hypothetical protein OS493_028885 [Desmophyllum pertusum]|uniref:Uncharacterized protein n=1 Tax=Desmophyllum pertusum TaxID=174260 RepID=A0A9X0D150_9CNID|nr:hypothetical protein OS493_028885 [Desmophyllum pertusum]
MNSIPCNLDLGVAMEPVDVISVTPTPTGTPREEVTAQDSQLCALASQLTGCDFSCKYSPTPVQAPAPTPISPDRHGQYSRTPHTREHSTSITSRDSRHIRRWETLSSVYDQDEPEMSREALGSPEGRGTR